VTRVVEHTTRSHTAASRIAAVLARHPGPWATTDLAKHSGTSGTSFDLALALLAAHGAAMSTRRLGVQAGPALAEESPSACGSWAATFGEHLEPYLAELVRASPVVPVVSMRVQGGAFELARYERGHLMAFWGGQVADHATDGAARIRVLRGSVLLSAVHQLDIAGAAALHNTATRIQTHLGRVYPVITVPMSMSTVSP
jgi:hypothetical protein